jgi:hypothetical protein
MTFKEVFKSIEGIAVLGCFILVILKGDFYAYVGIIAYLLLNVAGLVTKTVGALGYVWGKVKQFNKWF